MADDNDIIVRLKVEGVNKFKTDLTGAETTIEGMDSSITSLNTTLDVAKTKLSGMKEGTKAFTALQNEIKATEVGMKSVGDSMENAKTKLRNMQKEIVNMTFALNDMKKAGLSGTQQFKSLESEIKRMTNSAGELKDTIGDVAETVRNAGSDTRGIDNALRAVTSLTAGFQVVQGASALFGKDSEELQKTLVRLNAVMSITQGLQQIQAELLRNDSVFTLAATKAKQAYNIVIGTSTGLLKGFRLALAATGIGLVIVGIIALYENWDKLTASIKRSTISLEDYKKKQEEIRASDKKKLEDLDAELKYRIAIGDISEKQAKAAALLAQGNLLEKENEEYLKQLDTLKKLEQRKPKKFVGIYDITPAQLKAEIDKQRQIVAEAEKSVKDLTVSVITATNEFTKVSDKSKETNTNLATATARAKDNIEQLASLGLVAGQNSEIFLRGQLAFFSELQSALEIGSEEYRQLGEIIDLINKKIAGKQKVGEIDFTDALKGISKVDIQGKPLTLFDRIFGTKAENETRLQEMQRMAEGALKISDQLFSYGNQIANIATQAIAISTQNQLNLLQEKKDKGLITEKEFERKSAEIKTEAARKERAAQIAQAVAQIPIAILTAFISGSKISPIVGSILAGIAGAFATAQVALLAAAPLPKFKTGGSVAKKLGYIQGKKHESGGVPIEVEGGEYVMKSDAVKRYGVKFLDNINNLKLNPVIASGAKIKAKSDKEFRMNENLATMASYLKQVYKTDAQGNIILTQIRDNIAKNNKVYV